jgi:hypothetical protein
MQNTNSKKHSFSTRMEIIGDEKLYELLRLGTMDAKDGNAKEVVEAAHTNGDKEKCLL